MDSYKTRRDWRVLQESILDQFYSQKNLIPMTHSKKEYIVNLDLPPKERWTFLKDFKEELNELIDYYLSELDEQSLFSDNIESYKNEIIPVEYLEEIEYISSISKFTPNQILIANLYYDILKFYFGCTAFAFYNGNTILHARNLDWHTENNMLGKYSKIFDFRMEGKTVFKTVGWAGFIGALSGTKPNTFTVTLNAVLSDDSPEIAYPVSFLLSDVLAFANRFQTSPPRSSSIKARQTEGSPLHPS